MDLNILFDYYNFLIKNSFDFDIYKRYRDLIYGTMLINIDIHHYSMDDNILSFYN
jgi:hypothetical protein